MHEQAREPEPGRVRRPRAEPAPPSHEVLALQRQVGNQAVQRMLLARTKDPTRLPIEPVTELYKGTDADTWAADVRDDASPHLVDLYSELATLLHATAIEDVKGTGPKDIHAALRPAADELQPGLNFAARLSERGQTGYLFDDRFDAKLPAGRNDPLPKGVAVVLGPHAFEARNKASTLAVLRHELEHAGHDQMALGWLKRWRADSAAAKTSFTSWLEKQGIAGADLALVRERVAGGTVDTEALAHLEGFIAGFPLEAANVSEGAHPVYVELEVGADDWISADAAVKEEFSARLKALTARLTGERRTTFAAVMKQLKAHDSRLAKLADPLLDAK
jgi:hypothetical protein